MRRTSGLAAALAALIASPLVGQERSLTLDEAISLAIQAQPTMVQARGQVRSAGANRRQVIGSWLPDLRLSSGVSTNSTSRFDPNTQTQLTGNSTSYSGSFSASMVVFDGFSRLAQGRAANADIASADAALVNQRFQVTLQTKQAFFNALAAADLLRVADTRIERADEQLKIAKEKLANGTATRSDTLRSRVELANAQLLRLNAETQLATAQANLARLVGLDGVVQATPDERLMGLAPLDTAELRQQALAQSPEILQADAAAKSADAQVTVSRAQYFPSVSASYSRSWAGQSIGELNPSWSARLSFSYPLFNGFSRELQVTRSAVSRESAYAQAQDARRQVNAQLTQYLAALASARTALEIAQANQAASTEDVRVQRERYRLGAATIVDVLASQVNLDQAEVDIVRARFDFLVAKAQIEALVGREL